MPMLFLRAEKKYFSRAKILKILNNDDDDVNDDDDDDDDVKLG